MKDRCNWKSILSREIGVPFACSLEKVKIIGAAIFFMLVSILLWFFLQHGYLVLDGADTLCHIYRADILLNQIRQGVIYPLYDPMWYNGVEIMRYWSPLPLYFLAFVRWITGENAVDSFSVFLSCLFFIGSCGWLCFGVYYRRIGLSVLIGVIWFFCPENIRICTTDGNIPRMVINAILPFFCYVLWRYLEEQKTKHLLYFIVLFLGMVLCHLGIALIVLVSTLVFMFFYGFSRKKFQAQGFLFLGFVLTLLIAGIWLVPAMHGGAVSNNTGNNQVMQYFFQSIFQSLNPRKRITGDMLTFYYGISIFLLGIFGSLLSRKKTRIIFIVGLLLFLCTGENAYTIFSSLPLSQYLWMIRWIPLSVIFILMGFILWNSLNKWLVFIVGIFLILDCIPSMQYLYQMSQGKGETSTQIIEYIATREGLTKAKSITKQRLAVMDLSSYGSFAPYYISGAEPKVPYIFGAGWEGAATAENIMRFNSSMELGHYAYLFDRSLELGSDVVLIPIGNIKHGNYDLENLKAAARKSGFHYIKTTKEQALFQYPASGTFGTITRYENLAIGSSAKDIALLFPDFEEGSSDCIEDYSLHKLLDYERIYLSGFTYRNKKMAEEIMQTLANQGVQIFIDMNQIPFDQETGRNQLFHVSAQTIVFEEKYPALTYKDKKYDSVSFTSELQHWNTVYLDGLKNTTGKCNFQNREVAFVGTDATGNIHFLGANIVYHTLLTRDAEVLNLLEVLFGESYGTLPSRKIVPVTIEYQPNKIVIQTRENSVNTALAYLDIFEANHPIEIKNNLILVSSGRTELRINYPYLMDGILVSCLGVLLSTIFFIYLFRKEHVKTMIYHREA